MTKLINNIFDIRLLLFFPMIIMMIIIYGFSNEDGNESSSVSLEVTTQVVETVDTVIYDDTMTESTMEYWIEKLHLPIRKMAHMGEYGLLALLCFLPLLAYSIRLTKFNYIFPVILSFTYACTDEAHQLFVNKRDGNFKDVLIDTSGSIIMMFFTFLIVKLIITILNKKNEKKTVDIVKYDN